MQLDVSNNSLVVSFPHTCPKLTEHGCSIYDKRPLACRVFDGRKHIVSKDFCLWDKNELRRRI